VPPFNVRLRQSNWDAVHGPRVFRRGLLMRMMAYSIAELVQAYRLGKLNDAFCASYVRWNLESAYLTPDK